MTAEFFTSSLRLTDGVIARQRWESVGLSGLPFALRPANWLHR